MLAVSHSVQRLIKSYMRWFCIYTAHRASSPSQHTVSSLIQTQMGLTHKSLLCLAQVRLSDSVGFCAKMAFQSNK